MSHSKTPTQTTNLTAETQGTNWLHTNERGQHANVRPSSRLKHVFALQAVK